MRTHRIISCIALAGFALACGPRLAYAGARDFAVYTPGLGGTAQQAKPYLETFLRDIEKRLGWPAGTAAGDYLEDVRAVTDYVADKKPGYAMLAPSMFLELACREKDTVEPLVSVVGVAGTNGPNRYHVVTKDPSIKDLQTLMGKRLASNHLQNPRFLSRVVFGGKVDVEKAFKLLPTVSPLRPLKQVDRGEAEAALIDEAQLQSLKTLPFGQALHVLYSSEALPPFPLVAFTHVAPASDREKMRKTLLSLCSSSSGKEVCKALQVTRFEPIAAGAFQKALKDYCQP